MRRRHLLALAPAAALAACTAPEEDPASPGSDGGGAAPSDGGDGGTAPSDGDPSDGEEPTTTAPPSAAEQLLEGLSPREIAGQLVLVGIAAGSEIPPATFEEHHAGGIFLLQVWEGAEQVDAVVDSALALARPELPPLLAVDQEGGQVRMLRGDAARETASAETLGAEGPQAVADAYTSIGEDLSARGLHVALSPVADVVDPELGDANEPVGGLDRGFGTDPEQVADCVTAAVEALSEQGIGATLKHFPGLGRVEQNTDFSAEGIEDATTGPEDPFLESFRAGIDAGAQLVMMSSAIYPRIEPDVPAMFSAAAIQDLLRDGLGFEGLVVTDDIGAAQAVADVPVAERATRLLEAGGDAVLTADPSLTGELVDAIEEWAGRGEEQEQRVRESAGRMLALKEELGLL
ncbi:MULTISPECIES: glycoside hydrolase family 3 N-terminal domain-containing protein [Brachybacterium]|uniref:beta-N-acetylhexosaminidase n=2 Tax=Brachybacterium TaxID=43668 RepID=A0A426SQ49_9MICO|nr:MULTISPECIES: glycoside hydrolase family 3 N-terminal domain-containing protein [Brachybacterium]RRR20338.1 glycoside hydrolase family 3 protein [Brachybacterium paraconglomeratum]GLI32223.1 beta-glucosidase [Brachybacterium conglomeratum]GLK03757.1 beta-glucosidase [Brachybacterium conglomeratum]